MTTVLRLAGIAALLWLSFFTGAKLIKMAQIRGFFRGPTPESKLITAKATEPGSYSDVFWIAWNDADIRTPSRNRINLPKHVWESYTVGDHIDILYFPGDLWPYHRDDIFAENGNFLFDSVLLCAWIIGIATLVSFQIRRFLGSRRRFPPPLPSAFSQ
jgi:hypothetical protein